MHDIRTIRETPEALKAAMLRRHKPEEAAKVDEIVALDARYRSALGEKETLLARRNAASKEIGQAMAAKDLGKAEALKAEVAAGKDRLTALEGEAGRLEAALREMLAGLPNVPLPEVPEGADETGNVEIRRHGAAPDMAARGLNGAPREHYELGEALGQMDFSTAAKLSGSRFVVLNRGLARLERALGQFMLDLHTTEHGYTEVNPPLLVRDEVMFGTAQLPKFREDQFMGASDGSRTELLGEALRHVSAGDVQCFKEELLSLSDLVARTLARAPSREDRWLIPTAEVPLTNLVRESILTEAELPLRYTALTPCFRAEAGSAGRDTRGMLRQHQFMKVELVSITTPEASKDEHERMLACAETVLRRLDLHYRVVTLCAGDMGFASQKTYDIEVWLPGQNTYREISSCSVCGDFQARRMEARYRPTGEKGTRFVHTLNGSGIAVGRALIAVMENYQNPDGSIEVPASLRGYMGGMARIARA